VRTLKPHISAHMGAHIAGSRTVKQEIFGASCRALCALGREVRFALRERDVRWGWSLWVFVDLGSLDVYQSACYR
jgi:hypothetical protein